MSSHPRRRLARLAVVTAAGVVLAGAGASPALADAIDGCKAVHFNLTCGGEQFSVVSPSERAAAVQLAGSTGVLVGTDALLTTSHTDAQTGQPVATTQHIVYVVFLGVVVVWRVPTSRWFLRRPTIRAMRPAAGRGHRPSRTRSCPGTAHDRQATGSRRPGAGTCLRCGHGRSRR